MNASYALALGSTIAVILFGGFAAVRYFIGYWRSGLPLYGAVTVASLLVIEAQISMHLATAWRGTFWLYHIQLVVGCLTVLWAIVAEYGRGRALQSIEQLTTSDVMSPLRAGQTESVVSLAAALEGRDGYTLGHGERVAALAILVGRHMRVPAPRLRAIAAGALLHDVGKIGIPDAVLHKRGPLNAEEYDVIKEHTTRGDTMISAAVSAVPSNAPWCDTTTSDGTALATPTASRTRRSRWRRESSRWPMCTTPSAPIVPTEARTPAPRRSG